MILVTEVPSQELKVLEPLLYPCVCKSKGTVVVWCKYQLSEGFTQYAHFGEKLTCKGFL